jgi:hypothetical protein
MQVPRTMNMIPPDAPRMRRHARELHISTKIVIPAGTLEALFARYAWLDSHAVADSDIGDAGAYPDDYAGPFVAETVGGLDFEVAYAAGVPEVDV